MKKKIETDIPASNFLMHADEDYLAVRLLFLCGSVMHGLAAYHAQQAVEKYIKAFTVQKLNTYLPTHNLELLRAMAGDIHPFFLEEQIKTDINRFNVFDQVTRYGAESTYDPHSVETGAGSVKGMWAFGGADVKILDRVVFNIRGLIDFTQLAFADPISAILKEQKNHLFTATWKLPVSLKQILISGNDYFK